MSLPNLSIKDSHILARLFDPECSPSINLSASTVNDSTHPQTTNLSFISLPGSKTHLIINPQLSPDAHIKDVSLLEDLKNRELTAVKLAEGGDDVEGGLRLLDEIVGSKEGEKYANAWVNRATCKRLVNSKRPEEERLSTRRMIGEMAIIDDLRMGISLALGVDSTPLANHDLDSFFLPIPDGEKVSISEKQKKVLSEAYTHLGTIYLLLSKEEKNTDMKKSERLEELSSKYFELGGMLGNEIGRALAVKTNPYAKMCGAMVKEVMRRELGQEN